MRAPQARLVGVNIPKLRVDVRPSLSSVVGCAIRQPDQSVSRAKTAIADFDVDPFHQGRKSESELLLVARDNLGIGGSQMRGSWGADIGQPFPQLAPDRSNGKFVHASTSTGYRVP
jgi:hypothetical protein